MVRVYWDFKLHIESKTKLYTKEIVDVLETALTDLLENGVISAYEFQEIVGGKTS